MEKRDSDQLLIPSVTERWTTVLKVRHEFASELAQMASELPGDGSKHLRSMSRWFNGPAKLEDALHRPDVMAISLPLIKSSTNDQVSPADIQQAARLGFCSIGRNASVSRHLLRLMAYPILVLLAAWLIGVLFSFWIAPEFEEMFEEFGIELPSVTLAVLGFAQLIRRWWWVVLAVPAGVILANWILNQATSVNRPEGSSWIDQKLMSTRDSLASWAWHISLLLEAGLTQSEAIKNAGIATGKSWLRERSFEWAKNRQSRDPTNEQPYFDNPKFQLLDRAMQLPPSAGKVALLQEVATFYWDRNRTIGDWWVQWLVVLIMWLVGAAIFISILSLFMPLIAIVSGLTSTKA